MSASPRRPGTGTIEELPSGRARYRLTLASGRRVTSQAFADRDEAERQLDAARALVCAGEILDVHTLGAWGLAWLDLRRTVNASKEVGLWRQHVLGSALAELPVQEVRLRHVKAWAERELPTHRVLIQVGEGRRAPGDEAISIKTRRHCVALVRLVLAGAVEEEVITTNPAAELRIRWPDEGHAEDVRFLEEGQIAHLLGCEAVPLAARLHYGWALGSGARQGESWALRWRDLDLAQLRGEISRSGARQTTKAGKVRRFALLPLAGESLLRWRELAPSTHPDALVWPAARRKGDPASGRRRGEGDDYGWADRSRGAQGVALGHRTLAGLPGGLTYHALRHTACAGLLRGYAVLGVSRAWTLDEVCDWIGHSSRQVTEIYAHISGGGLGDRAVRESTASPRLLGGGGLRQGASATGERVAPATGLEPVTRWLTANGSATAGAELGPVVDSPWTLAARLAQDLLLQVAQGRTVDPVRLACAALAAGDQVELAQQVIAGAPLAQAIRLAGLVLDGARRQRAIAG